MRLAISASLGVISHCASVRPSATCFFNCANLGAAAINALDIAFMFSSLLSSIVASVSVLSKAEPSIALFTLAIPSWLIAPLLSKNTPCSVGDNIFFAYS